MGVLKNLMIEWNERGYGPIEGSVCSRHVHDQFLQDRIEEIGTETCSYCGRQDAAPLEAVMAYVKAAVDEHYLPAIDHLMWDDLLNAPDAEDVLLDVAADDFDEDVFSDLVAALSENDDRWIPISEDGRLGDSWLRAGWARFRIWVITKSRFLLEPSSDEDREYGEAPQEMLRAIGDMILAEDLFRRLDQGTPIYRARVLGEGKGTVTTRDMSAPPPDHATAGRMNPRGIPMFYGALDAETAAYEVYDGSHQAVVAEFRTLQDLEIVDLTRLPSLPSIYDVERSGRFRRLLFIADFARDIARPIDRDDSRELEYLPSQAVIEYLHLGLPQVIGTPIHGVLFRSSRTSDSSAYAYPDTPTESGINLTLFGGPESALTDDEILASSDSPIRIRLEDQLLEINPEGIRMYEYGPPTGQFRHNIRLEPIDPSRLRDGSS